MDTTQQLERLGQKLRRAGLPRKYIQRTLSELKDHLLEAEADGSSEADAILVDSLASQFIQSYRTASWYRRMPSFVWIPLAFPFAIVFCLAFYMFLLVPVATLRGWFADDFHATMLDVVLLNSLFYIGKVLAPLLAGVVFISILKKTGRPLWVTFASMMGLSLAFLLITTDMSMSLARSEGSLSLGLETDDIEQLSHWPFVQSFVIVTTLAVGLFWERLAWRRSIDQELLC